MSDNLNLTEPAVRIDDCWNRIGVQGDKSCERLREHVHCRNCEVHAAAAINLLERYASVQEDVERVADEPVVERCSLLVFRVADEWLALKTRGLVEVVAQLPIHSLPHQRSRSLLGVANVRGTLVACLSLGELLGIAAGAPPVASQRAIARMLILAGPGGSVVVPVDEVEGIHAIPLHSVQPAVGDGGLAVSQFASGVMQWQGRSITQLDEERLQQAMSRSFA
ncbi:chemotaxis-related protein WspD [Pseudomonas guineae]|uniref:Chemotaxis protein CheW n=1 Tax=Pseudomonas guineae TaxID=425504 RepID=A0A1I3DHU3_9PSED|nr:chemotaxis protein CheW [Pseudomonas guineae]SFH86342.1 chemotaxis-related protein WspD [Pseudomonas guineae]